MVLRHTLPVFTGLGRCPIVKICEDFGAEKVCEIANCIYNTGKIPRQMRESIIITLLKKGDLLLCSNYRLISLMSHITKKILRVVMARVRNKVNPEISEGQFGFCNGKGTRNAIFVARILGERVTKMQNDLYAVSVDYEKAFDRVKHQEIVNDLMAINIDGKDVRVLTNLYWSQLAFMNKEMVTSCTAPVKTVKEMMWFYVTLPVFTGLGRCPIVSWDFAGAVSIFGPDALPVVHQ